MLKEDLARDRESLGLQLVDERRNLTGRTVPAGHLALGRDPGLLEQKQILENLIAVFRKHKLQYLQAWAHLFVISQI